MDSFTTWILKGLSRKQGKTRLSQISDLIDWTPIRRRLDEMYHNKGEKGGRPNCDVILMFKILICHFLVFPIRLQIPGRYGYSKNAWRRQEWTKLSGQNFKGNWMLWVCRSNAERSKMSRLSRPIMDLQKNHVVTRP